MSACKYGDPLCPCQDGDECHYEGKNPMVPPVQDIAARSRHLPGFRAVPPYRRESVPEPVATLSEETRRRLLRLSVIGI